MIGVLHFGVPPLEEEPGEVALPLPRKFSDFWVENGTFGAFWVLFVDVNLFLMIKNKFTSKIAYHLKFLPTFRGEVIISPSPVTAS